MSASFVFTGVARYGGGSYKAALAPEKGGHHEVGGSPWLLPPLRLPHSVAMG